MKNEIPEGVASLKDWIALSENFKRLEASADTERTLSPQEKKREQVRRIRSNHKKRVGEL